MNETREQKVAAARARMAELAARFIERTRDDLRAMRANLVKAQSGDAAALAQIRQLAHRLAGTGPTLGFAALGESAAGMEALLDSLPAGAVADATLLARLARDLQALESHLERDAHRAR